MHCTMASMYTLLTTVTGLWSPVHLPLQNITIYTVRCTVPVPDSVSPNKAILSQQNVANDPD